MKPVLIALLLAFVVTPYTLMAAQTAGPAYDAYTGRLFDGSGLGIVVWVVVGFAAGVFVAQYFADKLPRVFKPAPSQEQITKTIRDELLEEIKKLLPAK